MGIGALRFKGVGEIYLELPAPSGGGADCVANWFTPSSNRQPWSKSILKESFITNLKSDSSKIGLG